MVTLLGGGGDANAERPVLDRFLELSADGAVAYVPVALDLDDYSAATAYAVTALGRPVETWTDLRSRSPRDVDALAGVFLGGGNTFSLLAEVRGSGLAATLSGAAATRVVYGGSAGAIILGADIGTARFFDPNSVGLDDTRGLGLVGAHAVWCHFVDEHCDVLRSWIGAAKCPVVALTERAGAEVNNGVLISIGYEPLALFDTDGRRTDLAPGRSIPIV